MLEKSEMITESNIANFDAYMKEYVSKARDAVAKCDAVSEMKDEKINKVIPPTLKRDPLSLWNWQLRSLRKDLLVLERETSTLRELQQELDE